MNLCLDHNDQVTLAVKVGDSGWRIGFLSPRPPALALSIGTASFAVQPPYAVLRDALPAWPMLVAFPREPLKPYFAFVDATGHVEKPYYMGIQGVKRCAMVWSTSTWGAGLTERVLGDACVELLHTARARYPTWDSAYRRLRAHRPVTELTVVQVPEQPTPPTVDE